MLKISLNITKTIFTFLAVVMFVVASINVPVYATPEEDLEEIQRQLEEIRKKKDKIEDTINQESQLQDQYTAELYKLKGELDLLDAEIQEKELVIKELDAQIKILEKNIKLTEEFIITTEGEVEELQIETDNRLIDMYMSQKTFSSLDLFLSTQGTDIVKLDLYQTSIQQETNLMLTDLEEKKETLAKEKAKLEKDRIQVQRDEVQIEQEKTALEKDKAQLDQQRAIFYRRRNESLAKINENEDLLELITEEEQQAIAEQTRLEQEIFNNVGSIPNGTYVTKGTIIGFQGCTGYCTGPHLHFAVRENGGYRNPCGVLPSGHLSGCGVNGSSMEFPMRGSYVLTSGYGWRWGRFHYAIDVANYNSSAAIYAAHNGYMIKGFEPCSSSNPLCKNGGANYRIICEDKNNCSNGTSTMYWHLRN